MDSSVEVMVADDKQVLIVDNLLRSAEDDVVDGDEEKLDDVADAAHDCEPDGAGCSDLLEFYIGVELPATSGFSQTSRKRLLAP